MQEKLLTTKQVAEKFQVCSRVITQKFIKEGLKFIKVGAKDYRFLEKDVDEFIEIKKQLAEQETIRVHPIKNKVKHKTWNIDYQKRKINLELNKVV